ncbi:hypothetical protein DB345_03920 [Spartobacteria bacterium LR76]|nr:hypothetical protein DB345_03920 [Spartobacteria bacterium LR76]
MYDGQAEDFDDLNVYMGINDTLEMPRMSSKLGEGFGKGHERFTNVCSLATRPLRWRVTDSEMVVVAEVSGKAAYLCGGEYFEGHILSLCYDGAAIELSECPPGVEKWSFSGMLKKLFGPPF